MGMETGHKPAAEADPDAGTMGGAGLQSDGVAELFQDCTHDLVAPLNQVSVLVALLVRKNKAILSGTDSQEILENIEISVKRMRILSEGMKKLSRVLGEPMAPASLEAADVLAGAIRNCGRKFNAGDFEIVCGPLPAIRADGKSMEFVFEELLENAIKHRAQTPVHIEIGAATGPGTWIFSVRDDGPGFDERWAREVFRMFRRIDPRAAGGSGVGLTICRGIIGLHHGEMWAESAPARGTTIFFTLPRLPFSGPPHRDATPEREGGA